MARPRKLKYFKCPKCESIETQEPHTIGVSHTHEGKIYKCEETDAEGKMLQPRVDKKPRGKSHYVDGLNGATI